jgi:hypothetical protein
LKFIRGFEKGPWNAQAGPTREHLHRHQLRVGGERLPHHLEAGFNRVLNIQQGV